MTAITEQALVEAGYKKRDTKYYKVIYQNDCIQDKIGAIRDIVQNKQQFCVYLHFWGSTPYYFEHIQTIEQLERLYELLKEPEHDSAKQS